MKMAEVPTEVWQLSIGCGLILIAFWCYEWYQMIQEDKEDDAYRREIQRINSLRRIPDVRTCTGKPAHADRPVSGSRED